jgi:plastocyanin
MKGYAILLIALICGILISGCIALSSGQKQISSTTHITTNQITTKIPTGPTVTVIIKARAFDPSMITIKEGTTVTWTNEDTMLHHVVHLPDVTQTQLFDSGSLSPGQSFSYTFEENGRYNYGDPQIGGGQSQPPVVIVE